MISEQMQLLAIATTIIELETVETDLAEFKCELHHSVAL